MTVSMYAVSFNTVQVNIVLCTKLFIIYRRPHISLLVLGLLLHMHQTQALLCGCSHLTARQTCLASLDRGTTSEYHQKVHL